MVDITAKLTTKELSMAWHGLQFLGDTKCLSFVKTARLQWRHIKDMYGRRFAVLPGVQSLATSAY